MTHKRAIGLLLLTAIFWSLGGVLLKAVVWHPMAKAGIRCLFAGIVLAIWMRGRPWRFSRRQIAVAFAYAVTLTLFVIANDFTTAANAIFLQYTAPIYVALMSWWVLGERTRGMDWLWVCIAIAGIALFFRDSLGAGRWRGDLAALGSGISFATMVLLLRREREGSPEAGMLLGNAIVAVAALPWYFDRIPAPGEWLVLGVLGVVQIGIPYILYAVAIRHVTANEAILIPALEPILNPVWVVLAQGEMPGPWALAGGLLVISAVLGRGFTPKTLPA